jgi:hypothetical protein
MRMYVGLNQAICAPELKKMFGNARNELKAFDEAKFKSQSPVTKEEMLEIVDAMEPLMLHVQKKMCPDGKLDSVKIYQIYQRFVDILCKDDSLLNGLISKPLEVKLTKTIALFE